ncbi:membrane frizzled-related protein [Carassius carassius]|uniref:membrane frizzled-related protein n=1 Tax=Carassius carassius TaxID=217509 RepID=UPI002869347B|nr:membrane frizzled-related protein [Carassius carassius]
MVSQDAKMMDSELSTESPDSYENVFCNPVFQLDEENEESKGHFKIDIYLEPAKAPAAGPGVVSDCVMTIRGQLAGHGAVIVSAGVLLTAAVLCLILLLVLRHVRNNTGEIFPLDSRPGDRSSQNLSLSPTSPLPMNTSTLSLPGKKPIFLTSCGGELTDSWGTLSSPNHPGPYPPDSHCVWVIRVSPPLLLQIHVSSLALEGPSPCLFDWLEVREETEKTSAVTRFCGSVAPPTLNTNSSTVLVSFHSDGSISGNGFTVQYHSVLPGQKSCSREEFMCDGGRCLLPVSVCDGQPNCQDRSDEANCSQKHKECGGKITGEYGSLSSPNHPKPYPHKQLCSWQISVEDGQVIRLSFQNFSLETQDVCEFDYVEVYDGADTDASTLLGRFCGPALPPDLTSSGPVMTVLFVADEGVADSGFYASFMAMFLSERTCGPAEFACGSGECLHQDWLCDGWSDCADAADEHHCINSTYPPFISSCEPIQIEMCRGLSYNLTSFPNIWLSISDQREAASILHKYRVLMEFGCFESFRRLVCGVFVPHCSAQSGVLQPCQSVCSSAEQQCSQTLTLLSLTWPFSCHLLPASHDPTECSLP